MTLMELRKRKQAVYISVKGDSGTPEQQTEFWCQVILFLTIPDKKLTILICSLISKERQIKLIRSI